MSFFDDDSSEFTTTSVEGVKIASVIKMGKNHPLPDKAGFSIAAEMLERAKWNHGCDEEGAAPCGGIGDYYPDPEDRNTVMRRGCKKYPGLRFRQLPVGNKTIDGYDIGTTWIRVLGVSGPRKYDTLDRKYLGPWKNSDWDALKSGDKKYRPVRNARVVFLGMIGGKLVRLHANPVQLRIDGVFGQTFQKCFDAIRRHATNVSRAMFNGAPRDLSTDLRDEELLAHVPLKLKLVSEMVGKVGATSPACVVKDILFINQHAGLVQPGSEESLLTIEQVGEARDWILGMDTADALCEDFDGDAPEENAMEPAKRRADSPLDGPANQRARYE